MKLFKSKKFRQGSIATVITVLGIVLVILLTSVLGTLSERFSWQLDMTKEQIFTITDDTKTFLKDVKKDVTIYVLNSEDGFTASAPATYFVQANEMLKNYRDLSSHISIKYVDIVKEPSFETNYPDLTLKRNDILVVSENRKFLFSSLELFNVNQTEQGAYVSSSKAEQTLTSAILNVTSDTQTIVTIIGGHDEFLINGFTSMLGMNNYQITNTNLLTDEIDPETTIAIMTAPKRDLNEDELKKLDQFLRNDNQYGKTLFYMASYQQPEPENFSNLNAFLAEWGIGVGESILLEGDNQHLVAAGNPYFHLVDYVENDNQPELRSVDYKNIFFYTRPVEILFEQGNGRTTSSLLATTGSSAVFPLSADNTWVFSEKDFTGPHNAFAMSRAIRYDGTTPLISNVLVLGSADALADSTLTSTSYANSEYFLSFLNKLVAKEDAIRIQSKTVDSNEMMITLGQVLVIGIIMVILLPLALIIVGLVIWLRRRHK